MKKSTHKPNTTAIFLLIYMILLFLYPEQSLKGVQSGLDLSFSVLIPSLYPFLFCSALFVKSGILDSISHKGVSLFILSFTGGYPVGAKFVSELYEKGQTDKNGAVKLLSYCINPSVSFCFSTVGVTLMKSRKAGLLILSAIVLSSLTMALISFLFGERKEYKTKQSNAYITESFSSLFVSSLKDGLSAIIIICGFVVIFSSLSFIVEALPLSESISLLFGCVLEVTRGVVLTAENFSLPFISALLSFGGFSTIFQLKAILQKTYISFLTLFMERLISAVFSAVYTFLLLKLFPIPKETFGTGGFTVTSSPSYSVSVSLCLVLMSVLFIMGDSIIAKKPLTDKKPIK